MKPSHHTLKNPDCSLIHALNETDFREAPQIAVSTWESHGKSLQYIGSQHGAINTNPTRAVIDKSFADFKPSAVIIESNGGSASAGYVAHVHILAGNGFANSSEDIYTAHLALGKGLPVMPGEIDAPATMRGMQEAGYKPEDVVSFFLLRQIPYWRSISRLDRDNFPQQAETFLARTHRETGLPIEQRADFSGFQKWFAQHNTTGRALLNIESHDIRPTTAPDANFFQRVQTAMDPIRERHTLGVIADALRAHDRVLVVYGNGHLLKSSPVLDDMFGHKAKTETILPVPSSHGTPSRPSAAASGLLTASV